MEKLLSASQVAQRLGVHTRTVQRMCRRGDLPNAFKVSNAWLIPQRDVDNYINKQKRKRQADA